MNIYHFPGFPESRGREAKAWGTLALSPRLIVTQAEPGFDLMDPSGHCGGAHGGEGGILPTPPQKHNLQKCSLQLHHEANLGKASMLEISIISLWVVQVVDFRFGWVPVSDD